MSPITKELIDQFKQANAAPFLFIGSGFSRRYLGLGNWEELLKRFTEDLNHPFEYYYTSASGDLPKVASLIAYDFHNYWWNNPEYEQQRIKYKEYLKDRTSALRVEICSYMNQLSMSIPNDSLYTDEIKALSELNVDGIITTNWDGFIEQLFPDYKVYIGQNELLFSNPQSIAEIYKIHGSASKPNSLVLTNDDYQEFERSNPYLAAKLITLFVEHPIVFIGYSLQDKNISNLLNSITSCLGEGNIKQLRNNLIFVKRLREDENEGVSQTYLTVGENQLPITIVSSNSFMPIYNALNEIKRKIPVHVLRHCKEQLYELVKSESPENKLHVATDIDETENKSDIEFVVGVGVAKASKLGYQRISALDLFRDLLEPSNNFDSNELLNTTIPELARSCTYLPIYKYLRAANINTQQEYEDSQYLLDNKLLTSTQEKFQEKQYENQFQRDWSNKTCKEIIDLAGRDKAVLYLCFVKLDSVNKIIVRNFLKDNLKQFDSKISGNKSTYWRKLASLLDWAENSWEC